ncbi:hypothetical protein F5887DRAFT_916436 [Amanita rubescens]|nr:hypothetical protein F5887DRAFT_916436 [Amanita rubescens]
MPSNVTGTTTTAAHKLRKPSPDSTLQLLVAADNQPTVLIQVFEGVNLSITIKNEKRCLSEEEIERMRLGRRGQVILSGRRGSTKARQGAQLSVIIHLQSQDITWWQTRRGGQRDNPRPHQTGLMRMALTPALTTLRRSLPVANVLPKVQGDQVVNPITGKLYSSDASQSSSDGNDILLVQPRRTVD